MRHDTTVAIVGAGLSGLTAARALRKAGIDHPGHLDGAIEAGERAAREIIELG